MYPVIFLPGSKTFFVLNEDSCQWKVLFKDSLKHNFFVLFCKSRLQEVEVIVSEKQHGKLAETAIKHQIQVYLAILGFT